MDSYRPRCNNNLNPMRRNGYSGNPRRMPEPPRPTRQPRPYENFLSGAQYPVAMAYVPWQEFQETYELSEALCIGTIFPELNRPFERARC